MSQSTPLDALQQQLNALEQQLQQVAQQHQQNIELNESSIARKAANLAAFARYLPGIAKEFAEYKPVNLKMIASPDGAANLFDASTDSWLYNEDPRAQCLAQVEKHIREPLYTKIAFSLDEVVQNTFIHTHYMNKMYAEYTKVADELTPLKGIPEHLGAGVIFGIGLGYHIEELTSRVSFDHLYICEPNIDWFYASLLVTDWVAILERVFNAGGYLVLNIGASYENFTTDYLNELRDKGSFYAANALIYQHYPSEALGKIIERFQHDFHMLTVGWGFFDDGVISIAHDYHNLKNQVPLLKKNATIPRDFANTPVFICANGPSLDYSLETIKEFQDTAVIFACGSAIVPLLQHGIVPDFHFEIERTKFTTDWLVRFVAKEDLARISFLSANIMHPGAFELFAWAGMAYKQTEPGTVLSHLFVPGGFDFTELKFCNPLVGNTALSYGCTLGFRDIYMFGTDNGYRRRDHHHSKHSVYYDADGNEKAAMGELVRAGEIKVDGNFGGEIYSTAFFNTGRFYLECLLKLYPKTQAYNTADGAKIGGASPLPIEDVLLAPNRRPKSELVSYIKNDMFAVREFDHDVYQAWLAIDDFATLCDEIIAYIDRDFTSRKELSIALREQARFLFAHSHTKFRHLYFLLEGSITYAHSVIRLCLYSFDDEQETLAVTKRTLAVFIEYLQAAKIKYRGVLNEVDDQECYLMDLL